MINPGMLYPLHSMLDPDLVPIMQPDRQKDHSVALARPATALTFILLDSRQSKILVLGNMVA